MLLQSLLIDRLRHNLRHRSTSANSLIQHTPPDIDEIIANPRLLQSHPTLLLQDQHTTDALLNHACSPEGGTHNFKIFILIAAIRIGAIQLLPRLIACDEDEVKPNAGIDCDYKITSCNGVLTSIMHIAVQQQQYAIAQWLVNSGSTFPTSGLVINVGPELRDILNFLINYQLRIDPATQFAFVEEIVANQAGHFNPEAFAMWYTYCDEMYTRLEQLTISNMISTLGESVGNLSLPKSVTKFPEDSENCLLHLAHCADEFSSDVKASSEYLPPELAQLIWIFTYSNRPFDYYCILGLACYCGHVGLISTYLPHYYQKVLQKLQPNLQLQQTTMLLKASIIGYQHQLMCLPEIKIEEQYIVDDERVVDPHIYIINLLLQQFSTVEQQFPTVKHFGTHADRLTFITLSNLKHFTTQCVAVLYQLLKHDFKLRLVDGHQHDILADPHQQASSIILATFNQIYYPNANNLQLEAKQQSNEHQFTNYFQRGPKKTHDRLLCMAIASNYGQLVIALLENYGVDVFVDLAMQYFKKLVQINNEIIYDNYTQLSIEQLLTKA